MTYLITFACYGARLHGDEAGTVDRHRNLIGTPTIAPNFRWAESERQDMLHAPYTLDSHARELVLVAIRKHCAYRGWFLFAVHVRSNHVHVVVQAEAEPERILNEFKSYASRELNQSGNDAPGRKRWARHGSTRWLRKDEAVEHALRYVIEGQGERMALFVSDEL